MSDSRDAFISKKAARLACTMCGAPRPGQKIAGVCGDCFALHVTVQAYNARRAAYHGALRCVFEPTPPPAAATTEKP